VKAAAVMVALALAGSEALAQDHVLTCGMEDCSQLGDPFFGLDQATADRMRAVAARFLATTEDQWTELVALSIGQVGCYEGWPAEDMFIDPYYDAAMVKLVRNLGLAPDEAEFLEVALSGVFYNGLDALAAQGRLVSVTEYDDELIPLACAG
jgi:hypothetical protein